jgi:hypothetical protein
LIPADGRQCGALTVRYRVALPESFDKEQHMTVRVPKYRLHNGSGQALVEIRGKRVYLGKYNSAESREKYRRLIAELMSPQRAAPPTDPGAPLRINGLILQYFRFAKSYYVKDGARTDEVAGIRAALRRLRKLYGRRGVDEFGPKAFKIVREAMVQEGLSRKYIGDSMARIRRMFRWAVAEEAGQSNRLSVASGGSRLSSWT